MPEPENTEGQTQETLPEKYKGKSAAEIAQMHAALEEKLGQMGQELGEARGFIQSIVAEREVSAAERRQEREPAGKDEYKAMAEDLLAAPDEVLPRFADNLEKRVMEKVERGVAERLAKQGRVQDFYRQNPELDKFREIVSVIGDRIHAANPNADFERVLEETKRRSLEYIATLKPRLEGSAADDARKRAGITTSGGGVAREARSQESGALNEPSTEGLDPEQKAIFDDIANRRKAREKAMLPPRNR